MRLGDQAWRQVVEAVLDDHAEVRGLVDRVFVLLMQNIFHLDVQHNILDKLYLMKKAIVQQPQGLHGLTN